MALAPSADNIILGKGELFWAPIVSGVKAPYFHLGNCPRFAILFNDDVITLNSSMDADGGVIKRTMRKREVNIEITSNEYGMENLALAMMGDSATFTQTTGTVTQTMTTSLVKDRYYKTTDRNVTITSLVAGTVTLTTGSTGYTLADSSAGMIFVPTASTAVTGTALVVIYTKAALSLDQVNVATQAKKEGGLLFVPDPTTGPQFDVEVWYASSSPGGEINYIGEEYGEYQLNMVAQKDAAGLYGGSTACPYIRQILRGSV